MTRASEHQTLRFGKEASVQVCPSCAGRGAKWVDDDAHDGGRPQLVRDLRGIARVKALRTHTLTQIWPCMTCQGEGFQ